MPSRDALSKCGGGLGRWWCSPTSRAWIESSMRFSVGLMKTGKTTPSNYLHRQLDVTDSRDGIDTGIEENESICRASSLHASGRRGPGTTYRFHIACIRNAGPDASAGWGRSWVLVPESAFHVSVRARVACSVPLHSRADPRHPRFLRRFECLVICGREERTSGLLPQPPPGSRSPVLAS